VLAAHRAVALQHPRLLTLLAPRHPARGDEVARLANDAGLAVSRRTRGDLPEANTDLYLIDTMGELGLFYRLAPIVLVAGSLGPAIGGHNPLEAAALGCAVLHGLDTLNSAAMTAALDTANAALPVDGVAGLIAALTGLLEDHERVRRMGEAGKAVAAAQGVVIDRVMAALEPLLARL
jgi:3-deoxy-D-manno-octulosonic-acid transferase